MPARVAPRRGLGAYRATRLKPAVLRRGETACRRGRIAVPVRQGLEGFACEGYPVLKAEFERPAA